MDIQVVISQMFSQIAAYLPFGYAFGAGMVSAVNPCGFFMLPVYLSLYLGAHGESGNTSMAARVGWAMWVCVLVTAGFGLVFALAGGLISAGGYFLMGIMPWFALVLGGVFIVMGIFLLLGKSISSSYLHRFSEKIGDPRDITAKGFFLFGIAYGTASLGCALPIFLALIGGAVTTGGVLAAGMQFGAYIAGMSCTLCILTFGILLLKVQSVVAAVHKLLPYSQKIAAFFLLVAGGYIIYYWLTSGMLVSA